MSLILDALRKSEAERRRGQVPDLHAEPVPGAQPARDGPSAWLWLALGLAAALVLSMALWLGRSVLTAPPRAIDVPETAAEPAAPQAATGAYAPGQGTEPREALAVDALPAVPEGPAAAPGPDPGPAPTPPATVTAAGIPSPPSEREPASTASPTPATAATMATIAVAPDTVADPALPMPRPTSAAVPVTAADSPTAPANIATPTSAPAPAGPALLRLADLDVEQRRQLPPLKMSMHLWAPTQRFAIIDGARVSEGDRIGDAVVEEITAGGVVLAWQGRRLQIPIR